MWRPRKKLRFCNKESSEACIYSNAPNKRKSIYFTDYYGIITNDIFIDFLITQRPADVTRVSETAGHIGRSGVEEARQILSRAKKAGVEQWVIFLSVEGVLLCSLHFFVSPMVSVHHSYNGKRTVLK